MEWLLWIEATQLKRRAGDAVGLVGDLRADPELGDR
jgi:hypothetical protein